MLYKPFDLRELIAATGRLLEHLQAPDVQADLADFADIAYTLQVGRRAFRHRRVLAARDLADGVCPCCRRLSTVPAEGRLNREGAGGAHCPRKAFA